MHTKYYRNNHQTVYGKRTVHTVQSVILLVILTALFFAVVGVI